MAKKLMKGCEAIGEAAIQAGCRHFFGYPITPQSEVPEYLSRRLPAVGGVFVQAESEVAASNMILGAAATGTRVLTTSSSPGISLMSEGISYIAGCELPVVLVNIVRGGPGLGGILPAQSDYNQATRGGGHGDYHLLVLAPASVQEAADLIGLGFDLADKYRNPVMVIGDGMIGQMMEPVEFRKSPVLDLPPKDWALTGARGRKARIITSLFLNGEELEALNLRLKAKYERMAREDVRFSTYNVEAGYDVLIVAYGTTARICQTAIDLLREKGVSVGMIRPITLYPYPYEAVAKAAEAARAVLTVEMSMGQMIDDVKLSVLGKRPIHFHGHAGGVIPTPDEVVERIHSIRAGFQS
ncbi:MAG: 3-methyl-2-oxobutanoate dehydrogenase subunit VorB [Candidatus Riflebacteria bacterium]|nr:3-methyl-2-oxobutanoate dehydrogenase subunit VorB [Candidatus Riflebacteria bacterium]